MPSWAVELKTAADADLAEAAGLFVGPRCLIALLDGGHYLTSSDLDAIDDPYMVEQTAQRLCQCVSAVLAIKGRHARVEAGKAYRVSESGELTPPTRGAALRSLQITWTSYPAEQLTRPGQITKLVSLYDDDDDVRDALALWGQAGASWAEYYKIGEIIATSMGAGKKRIGYERMAALSRTSTEEMRQLHATAQDASVLGVHTARHARLEGQAAYEPMREDAAHNLTEKVLICWLLRCLDPDWQYDGPDCSG
jgi:hypothetical protein